MGRIIKVSFDELLPGENYLNPKRLFDLFNFICPDKRLLPIPVRRLDDKYVHLDGRHRLIYSYLSGKEFDFYLAENEDDLIKAEDLRDIDYFMIDETNSFIHNRWYRAEIVSKQLNVKDYHEHFRNLQSRYKFLKDLETCKEHLDSAFA